MRTDAEYARMLDAENDLAYLRDEFILDDPDLIYLDGNSLGRLPKRSAARVEHVLRNEWGSRLIRGWNEGWYEAPVRIGAKIARLIGATDDEVIVADSTSVNLFKLVVCALTAARGKHKVVTDDLNFPSDIYIMQGALRTLGRDHALEVVHSRDGISVLPDQIGDAVDEDTALVALSHTAFKSGFTYNIADVTRMAREKGAFVLWDLCHSVGVLPIKLGEAGADLAVGCTYKYLNGGPGSPAFVFVRRELQERIVNPISGWFGQKGQFDFALDYQPASGMRRFLSGTPSMLSLAPVETSVDIILEVGIDRLRSLSIRQTEYLIGLFDELLKPLGVNLNSPRDARCRGAHVSLGHPDGLGIDRALIQEMNVIPDFRYPDNIRLGISPLYTTFAEIREAIIRFQRVLDEKLYEKYADQRIAVT